MLVLGGYTGKWFRKQHMGGGAVWKNRKHRLGSQPGRPGFQFFISHWILYDWLGFLDGATACWFAEWDSTSQKLRRTKVPYPAFHGRFPACGSLTSDRSRRASVVQSPSCQCAALTPIPGTMQKEKWRVHREWRELMICESPWLAFSM